jgi:hypothetical protein
MTFRIPRTQSIGKIKPLFTQSHLPASAYPLPPCSRWCPRLGSARPLGISSVGFQERADDNGTCYIINTFAKITQLDSIGFSIFRFCKSPLLNEKGVA